MALDREFDRVAGLREIREADASMEMAVGTLACPGCDAPVSLGGRPMSPGMGCTLLRRKASKPSPYLSRSGSKAGDAATTWKKRSSAVLPMPGRTSA